jgi:predicted ester cyclase
VAPTTTEIDPAAVVSRFLNEVINEQRLDLIEEVCAPDFSWDGGSAGHFDSASGYAERLGDLLKILTEMHIEILETIVSGNKVVSRLTTSCTHSGDFFGVAATGKRLSWLAIGIATIVDGKIATIRVAEDIAAAMSQLADG